MNKIIYLYLNTTKILGKLEALPLLSARLVLAYVFYITGTAKWKDINSVAEWFASLHIPMPKLSAYLTASTEITGVVLLILGLGTRFIPLPLIAIMLVAIKTVHWQNGFAARNNGYETLLYFIVMLFTLIVFGAGKLSIDQLIKTKYKQTLNP